MGAGDARHSGNVCCDAFLPRHNVLQRMAQPSLRLGDRRGQGVKPGTAAQGAPNPHRFHHKRAGPEEVVGVAPRARRGALAAVASQLHGLFGELPVPHGLKKTGGGWVLTEKKL